MPQNICIHITGKTKDCSIQPFTDVLSGYGVSLLDTEQRRLSDSIIVHFNICLKEKQALKPLTLHVKSTAHALGLEAEVSIQGSPHAEKKYILTLLAREVTCSTFHKIAAAVALTGGKILNTTTLSPFKPEGACHAIECVVALSSYATARLQTIFAHICTQTNTDIILQEKNIFCQNRRLIALDMDSTLIQTEVIDELGKRAGVAKEVADITTKAMRGELDFDMSLKKRVSLLQGLHASALEETAAALPYTKGAATLVKNLKRLGYKTAILSGGFDYFGKKIQEKLGFDFVFANMLEIHNGRLTGKVTGKIVNAKEKARLLQEITAGQGLDMGQTIAVGDGANDLPMLAVSGLGIAFHAKPIVRKKASHCVSYMGLDSILYLLGLKAHELLPKG